MRYIKEYKQEDRLYYTISDKTYQDRKAIKMSDKTTNIIKDATAGNSHYGCYDMTGPFGGHRGIHIGGYEYDGSGGVPGFGDDIEDKHYMDIKVYECEDEWFYASVECESDNYGSTRQRYKCDQMEGLLQFLKIIEIEFYEGKFH